MSSRILTLFDQDFTPKDDKDDSQAAAKAKKARGAKNRDDVRAPDLFGAFEEPAPIDEVKSAVDEVAETNIPEAAIPESIPSPELITAETVLTEQTESVPEQIDSESELIQEIPTEVTLTVEPESIPAATAESTEMVSVAPVEILATEVAEAISTAGVNERESVAPVAGDETAPAKVKRTRKAAEQGVQPDLPDDWKAEKQYYTIGEVAALFQVNTSHIRFWTNEFNLKVRTTRKGDRLYTGPQIMELKAIHHLVKERGFKLAGAKARLKEQKKKVVQALTLKESLTGLRDRLAILRDQLN